MTTGDVSVGPRGVGVRARLAVASGALGIARVSMASIPGRGEGATPPSGSTSGTDPAGAGAPA